MTDRRDTTRWLWRGVALAALLIGWLFIAWQNRFHVTAPMVFVCLGYLAVIATIYNLWRTGAAAVDASEDDAGDSTWAKPAGAIGELEREKRTLLKAIKEAEFDHQMGKLSQHDADEMIRGYRARAIEVIKEIDRLGLGSAGTVREQILREVRARVQLEGKSPKKPADAKAAKAKAAEAKAAEAKAAETTPAAALDARPADATTVDAAAEAASGAKAEAASVPNGAAGHGAAAGDAKAEAAEAAKAAEAAEAASDRPDDDELDADSTTVPEERHEAKEATR